jgi:hypothetical protein
VVADDVAVAQKGSCCRRSVGRAVLEKMRTNAELENFSEL